ncbi:MAG TPA: hypothetical protein VHT95_11390 [Vicinamibacterales bacterium]|nr:hypothetical protein [Vicinamibacterales bacterium]
MTPRQTRVAAVLGVALFLSYAYFYGAGGWNQNSRFALIRAILERHTLQIDAYQLHTGDRALWRGHYYTDKAPGASLVALAPVQAARLISRAAGIDPASFPGIAWTSYVASLVTSGVFTVIAALCVFWLSLRWGASTGAALFAAAGYGIATPAWAYATLFMGHGQTAGCLMIALVAADALGRANPLGYADRLSQSGPRGHAARRRLEWTIGLAGGWAVVTELQAAIPAVFIGLLAIGALVEDKRGDVPYDRVMRPAIIRIAAGVAVAAVPLLIYNALAFGSPFHLGYSSEEGFKELQTGFFGITYPRLSTVRELLVGSYRGLLPLSPLMAVAPVGLGVLASKGRRGPALVAAGIGAYYLLLNASYFYWEGGWAFGPRQMTAALPFLALGLAPLWDLGRAAGRTLLAAGLIWGAAITLVAVSTTPQPPATFKSPVTELLWPAFRDGDLSLNPQTFVHNGVDVAHLRGGGDPHAAWNLGELAGLRGLPSLLPLASIWIAAVVLLLLL